MHRMSKYTLFFLIYVTIAGALTQVFAAESPSTVLLYSNSPEKVLQPSLLYSANIAGPARLLFHHVNSTGIPLVLEVHLTNLTQFSSGLAFRVYQYQHPDPTQAGHYAVKQFWQDKTPINPDAPLPAFDNRIVASIPWTNSNTLSGVAWIYVAAPTKVSVVARPASGQFSVPLTPLSTTIFPLADLTDEIPYTLPRDPVVFSVGRGNFLDNTDKLLHGNYGVLYRYSIIASNPTQEKQKLNIYSRQAGGVSRAFVQINDQLMPIPTSAKYEKLLLLSRVLPPLSETIINLATMPQPGSNMPIDFLLESGGAVD